MSKSNWNSIREGKIYCSSACGGDCTYAAYKVAIARGERLLARMKGYGWRLRVHENLGWLYCVYSSNITVSPNYGASNVKRYPDESKLTYTCLINSEAGKPHAGSGLWSTDFYCKDPNKAVQHELNNARLVVAKLFAALVSAAKAAGENEPAMK
jgi:hypothetical protein